LPPGGQELTLSAVAPDGTETRAPGSVLLAIPGRKDAAPALAVLSGTGSATRVLQAPVTRRPGAFGLDAVDYDEHGAIRFSGHAPPGATVRVYVDNHPAGDAVAGPDGSWTLAPSGAVTPGQHRLRVDQLSGKGRVVARVELPFRREKIDPALLASGHVVVQPGESLWRIARHAYGQGVRYTVIFAANHDQIRDPDLIYPGQTFAVPKDGSAIPASASNSR
jgi:nucleoid-associated protein YgaU